MKAEIKSFRVLKDKELVFVSDRGEGHPLQREARVYLTAHSKHNQRRRVRVRFSNEPERLYYVPRREVYPIETMVVKSLCT